ncbi:MAG TPA: HYR domain-containing protein [Nitrososphaeraceae archaeon]|nr:HYR domain-containing protein [Nitrososphaeraceae archaeon]
MTASFIMIAQSIILPTGTTVTYEPPTATYYFLKSVACTPDSENLFALGTTEVTCTTKDTSDNIATKTFKVAVSYAEFSQFLQPINNDGSSVFKKGSVIPVKFYMIEDGSHASTCNTCTISYQEC